MIPIITALAALAAAFFMYKSWRATQDAAEASANGAKAATEGAKAAKREVEEFSAGNQPYIAFESVGKTKTSKAEKRYLLLDLLLEHVPQLLIFFSDAEFLATTEGIETPNTFDYLKNKNTIGNVYTLENHILKQNE